MTTEAPVQAAVVCSLDPPHQTAMVAKGKRTKRRRLPSPLRHVASESGTASPATSEDNSETMEEEEDMANCLMLLAQGSRRVSEPASSAGGTKAVGGGLFLYQCKTCNRRFPSFQALGGHRTSHKKPKGAITGEIDDELQKTSTALSLQISNRETGGSLVKSKVHECSVCGAEFLSGQALGGHMRRHRPIVKEMKEERSTLQLDLNLPAPEDDHHMEAKFKEQVIVFSASPLVGCQY